MESMWVKFCRGRKARDGVTPRHPPTPATYTLCRTGRCSLMRSLQVMHYASSIIPALPQRADTRLHGLRVALASRSWLSGISRLAKNSRAVMASFVRSIHALTFSDSSARQLSVTVTIHGVEVLWALRFSKPQGPWSGRYHVYRSQYLLQRRRQRLTAGRNNSVAGHCSSSGPSSLRPHNRCNTSSRCICTRHNRSHSSHSTTAATSAAALAAATPAAAAAV